jgi:hypothetical protein
MDELIEVSRREGWLREEDPGHARWHSLWIGTMALLQAQEFRAYRRVFAKLERHGLVGRALDLRSVNGRLTAAERLTWVSGLLSRDFGDAPDDVTPERRAAIKRSWASLLEQIRGYAADTRRVSPRRSMHVPPRILLVLAYHGALWKVRNDAGTSHRGESPEDRALALVANRYGFAIEAVRSMVKRTRPKLPQFWRTFLKATPGEQLWKTAMAPEVDVRTVATRKKGARER